MGAKINKDIFIERSLEKWGGEAFDYSKLEWKNFATKIILICKKHNYEFEQKAQKHLKGQNGCKYCNNNNLTTEDYINKSIELFGGEQFDYSKSEYKNTTTPVTLICKIHNTEWNQTPFYHFKGNNPCKDCNGQRPLTNETFIEKSKKIHGEDKFDYSQVTGVTNVHAKVILTCNEHGEVFEQGVRVNLRGQNACPKCNKYSRVTKSEFLERFRRAHGDRNDYSLIPWDDPTLNIKSYVPIRCTIHDITFNQSMDLHIQGKVSCPKCKSYVVSKGEKELGEFIESLGFTPVYNSRKIMGNGKELDIWIPEVKIAFEYNGEYWHSDEVIRERHGVSADEYHQEKVDAVGAVGGVLHFIWNDEWNENKDNCKKRVREVLGVEDLAGESEASVTTMGRINSEVLEKVEDDSLIDGGMLTLF